jgi:hypothetical protein
MTLIQAIRRQQYLTGSSLSLEVGFDEFHSGGLPEVNKQ